MTPADELSPEARALLDRLTAAKADQRTHHGETLEYLRCVRVMLGQLCAVATPEHLPGRYRSRVQVQFYAEILARHVKNLQREIDPE